GRGADSAELNVGAALSACTVGVHIPTSIKRQHTILWRMRALSLGKFGEHEVPALRGGVACSPALGVVCLRRIIRQCARPECIGGGVILELAQSPSPAPRHPFPA